MISLKTIVVATDFSDLSQCAVRHGCELANQFGATLHLLNVASFPYFEFAEQCQKDFGRTLEDCEKEYYAAAIDALAGVDASPLDESHVIRSGLQGFPREEILRYVDEVNADLLILGTHGHTGLKHVFLGSVAEAIVRTARCPVLTVRDSTHTFESAEQN